MRQFIAILGIIVGLAGLSSAAVRAADDIAASPWLASEHARIRLVPGASLPDGRRWVGVHIELEQGWHTYWRHPGSSGVPPRLDWSGSANLAGAEIKWPAPRRLRDDFGVSFGYLDEVVFPVIVSPAVPGKDISIGLAIDYAVCADICIPEFSQLTLELPANSEARPIFKTLVSRFGMSVPQPQSAGSSPRIDFADIEMNSGKPALFVTAELGGAIAGAELFVEGPEEFYFSVADGLENLGQGKGRFKVSVAGAKSIEDLAGVRLGGTLVTSAGATEYWWTVAGQSD